MNFLAPILLWFLPLVLLPLLFTWLRNRQAEEADYSSLYWLTEEIRSRFQQKQARRWLSALWRSLLLLLLIYLLARPVIGGLSQDTPELVLLFDNSYSMKQKQLGQTALETGKKWAAENLIPNLQPNSIRLGYLNPTPTWVGTYNSPDNLPLDKIKFKSGQTTLASLHGWLNRHLAGQSPRTVLVTDGQKQLFRGKIKKSNNLPVELAFPFSKSSNRTLLNGGLREKSLYRKQEGTIFWQTQPRHTTPDKIILEEKTEFIPKNTDNNLTWTPDQSGYVRGEIQLPPDSLAWDNHWYFTFPVRKQMRVLFLGNSPAVRSVKHIFGKRLKNVETPARADLVIIGDSNFSPESENFLQTAVARKTPRLLLLDKKFNLPAVESLLAGLNFPWVIEGELPLDKPLPVQIQQKDWFSAPHKLSTNLQEQMTVPEIIQVTGKNKTQPLVKAGEEIILARENEWIIYTLPPEPYLDPEQASAGWPALLTQVVYSAGRPEGIPNWQTGKRAEFPARTNFPVKLTTPQDKEIIIKRRQNVFQPEETGYYEVRDNRGQKFKIACNRNRKEANLARKPHDEWPENFYPYNGPKGKYSYPLATPLWLLLAAGFGLDIIFTVVD